jgi:hypothetical protein
MAKALLSWAERHALARIVVGGDRLELNVVRQSDTI